MRYKIIKSFTIASLLFFVAGCQKDQDFLSVAKSGSSPNAGFGYSNLDALSIGVDASVTKLDTNLKVFVGATYGSATTVTIAVDTSVVGDYNASTGSALDYMPAAVYTVPASISIPSGAHEGDGKLSVDITKFLTYGTEFALGLSITKVTGGPGAILTDHSRLCIVIQVKNPYDADYSVTGYLFHPTAPRSIKLTKHLTTSGAITSYTDLGDLGTSGYQFQFDVSSANKLTNWVSVGATPAAPKAGFMDLTVPLDFSGATTPPPANGLQGGAIYNSTIYNNTYNPSSSTFWMQYGYYSAGTPLPGTGEVTYSRQAYEKWVRQ
jgi:hypothetical protein